VVIEMMNIKIMIDNELIERKRKELRYTNQELAISLGYKTEAAVRKKIKGERNWTVSDIQKLVDILDITYEELYK
jgi:predicted transcriptional regulator